MMVNATKIVHKNFIRLTDPEIFQNVTRNMNIFFYLGLTRTPLVNAQCHINGDQIFLMFPSQK